MRQLVVSSYQLSLGAAPTLGEHIHPATRWCVNKIGGGIKHVPTLNSGSLVVQTQTECSLALFTHLTNSHY